MAVLRHISIILVGLSLASCGYIHRRLSKTPAETNEVGVSSEATCDIRKFRPSEFLSLVGNSDSANASATAEILARVDARLSEEVTTSLSSDGRDYSDERGLHLPLEFKWKGDRLCSSQFYATAHLVNGKLRIKGRLPTDLDLSSDQHGLPLSDETEIKSLLLQRLTNSTNADHSKIDISDLDRCWYAIDRQLQPAAVSRFSWEDTPYEAILVNGRIAEFYAMTLHATAKITTYKQNNRQPLEEILVDDMQPNGYLCNNYFFTNTNGIQNARNNGGFFKFDPSDDRFLESTLFAHANEMMRWFLSVDSAAHWSDAQVELRLSTDPKLSTGGPVYENPQGSSGLKTPVISVPDKFYIGGEAYLQNLATDFDVVAHELGHHIVTRYLPINEDRDLVTVHEGLADFFVFAKTGDACLGETICNDLSGKMCAVERQCLRSGDLGYKADAILDMGSHAKSQALSGMLWDLSKRHGIAIGDTVKLTFTTLKYLDKKTNLDDFFLELLNADAELFNGRDSCAIRRSAYDHGIAAAISKGVCSNL
ncbi:MAG: hypothetical protein NTY08_16260 [Proteobacteria bacterium]|nr:hypothetical protein [Pseudomonadota bacterium]